MFGWGGSDCDLVYSFIWGILISIWWNTLFEFPVWLPGLLCLIGSGILFFFWGGWSFHLANAPSPLGDGVVLQWERSGVIEERWNFSMKRFPFLICGDAERFSSGYEPFVSSGYGDFFHHSFNLTWVVWNILILLKLCCSPCCLVVKSDLWELNWLNGRRSRVTFMNFGFKA